LPQKLLFITGNPESYLTVIRTMWKGLESR
jgi:hypothetical protein